MADSAARRASPHALWPDVRSIVMVGASYAPGLNPIADLDRRTTGLVSVYAARKDYHDVMKGRLKDLAGYFKALSRNDVKVFVDTAPVMEKPLAAAAGIGWQGKHSVVVSRQHGSWLFLGALFTAADLPASAPHSDHCGSCRKCLDVCPTDAFPRPYQLDASRCLAYWSVEHAGVIPVAFRAPMGNRVFGCDDCVAICPWNRFATAARDAKLALRDDLRLTPLHDLAGLDDTTFRRRFAGTPVKRAGRDRFVRNVMIAIGNAGDPALGDICWRALRDPSPLVRGMAVWALERLAPERMGDALQQFRAHETDLTVIEEWRIAMLRGVA